VPSKQRDADLVGMNALVTGASRGIGKAIALHLAEAGANVIGVARSEADLQAVGSEARERGGEFMALAADLTDLSRATDTAGAAWDWHGGIDILVNAAGINIRTPALEVTPEEWNTLFTLNVSAAFFLTQAVGRRMIAAEGGSIVNITSLAGEVATGASVGYSSSKAALVHITRVLAVQWAPKVRVNAVGPGYTRTDMTLEWLATPENEQFVLDRTPLRRVGLPEDVVGAVSFLASPRASYVTGQQLLIDGGWTAQ
jgi:NAD(P)-dependent dehydrogenase (short-subunit alcohol dehydrogenase family)